MASLGIVLIGVLCMVHLGTPQCQKTGIIVNGSLKKEFTDLGGSWDPKTKNDCKRLCEEQESYWCTVSSFLFRVLFFQVHT